jgi:hypothetical protein
MRNGPAHQVPCPHCGIPSDYRETLQMVDPHRPRDSGTIECDHCHGMAEIVKLMPITVVTVRQAAANGAPANRPPAAAPAKPPTAIQRLLGRR